MLNEIAATQARVARGEADVMPPIPAGQRGGPVATVGPDERGLLARLTDRALASDNPVIGIGQQVGVIPEQRPQSLLSALGTAAAVTPIGRLKKAGTAVNLLDMPGRTLRSKIRRAIPTIGAFSPAGANAPLRSPVFDDLFNEMRDLVDAGQVTIRELSQAGRNAAEVREINDRLREIGRARRSMGT